MRGAVPVFRQLRPGGERRPRTKAIVSLSVVSRFRPQLTGRGSEVRVRSIYNTVARNTVKPVHAVTIGNNLQWRSEEFSH